MDLALLFAVRNLDMQESPLGKAGRAVEAGREVALETANHHRGKLFAVGTDSAGEALRVEKLEKGGEALGVAVVGCGGQEQLVLEVGGELTDGQCAKRVRGILARPEGAALWASSTTRMSNRRG